MNCLPYAGAAGNEITAAAGNTGSRTVIASGDPTMEKIVWQNE